MKQICSRSFDLGKIYWLCASFLDVVRVHPVIRRYFRWALFSPKFLALWPTVAGLKVNKLNFCQLRCKFFSSHSNCLLYIKILAFESVGLFIEGHSCSPARNVHDEIPLAHSGAPRKELVTVSFQLFVHCGQGRAPYRIETDRKDWKRPFLLSFMCCVIMSSFFRLLCYCFLL